MTRDLQGRDYEDLNRKGAEAAEPVGKANGLGFAENFATKVGKQHAPEAPAAAPAAAAPTQAPATAAPAAAPASEVAAAAPASAPAADVAAPAAAQDSREGGHGEAAGTAPAASGAPKAKPAALGKISMSGKSKGASDPIAKVAVGEKLTLVAPAGEVGSWTADGVDIGTGSEIKWQAPETAGGRVIKFETVTGSSTNMVVIIVAPKDVEFKKLGDVPSAGEGMAGVGMFLQVTVNPTDVSFDELEWLEKPGPAEETEGYFKSYVASGQSLAHPPNPTWLGMGADNKGVVDRAYSRDKPKLHKPGDPETAAPRWWAGSFQWTIPNVYRVKGSAGEHVFTKVVQKFTMNNEGAMTVSKGAASATAKPGGAVEGDLEKFATQAEAETYLSRFGRAGAIQAAMDYKRTGKADPASLGNLTGALNKFDIMWRVELTCKNTFAITDPDEVTVTANGIKANDKPTKKLNDKEGKVQEGKVGDNFGSFEFSLNKVLDLKNLNPAGFNVEANMESLISHKASVPIAFPYTKVEGNMHGDRYSYVMKIR